MFNFLLPARTKKALAEADLIYASLKRNRIYAQDTLAARDLETLSSIEERYPAVIKSRNAEELEKLSKEAMRVGNKLFPASPWDGWRENVEVFVVAAIMALAIRTFFLQPFKIPTGSMEPTLFGIEPKPALAPPPNLVVQAYEFLIRGRTYSHVVTEHGGRIVGMSPGSMTIWFEYTDLHLDDGQGHEETDRVWIRLSDVITKLGLYTYGSLDTKDSHPHLETYAPGAVLANYVTQTGDQVLVDKVSYNFRSPRRGEVFIFKTSGISIPNENPEEGSQDFIKRCVALAGDIVEVRPPQLFINGNLAEGSPAYAKQFAQTDGYPGYQTVIDGVGTGDSTAQKYYVPADCYWAMGDNSPNSEDSRYWNGVPRQNLVGRGAFVFWPFTSRWGFIR
jgi:signal peptidase I